MREEVLRSLLLIDSDPAERRLVAATASRAGWSLANAVSEGALDLLKGPHGREVRAALDAHRGAKRDELLDRFGYRRDPGFGRAFPEDREFHAAGAQLLMM